MEMNKALRELMSTMYWDVSIELLQTGRAVIQKNIENRIPLPRKENRDDVPYLLSSRTGFSERTYVVDGDAVNDNKDIEVSDAFITIIDVQGPIMRNGGACSYGSKEHRDIILNSVQKPGFIGLISCIDSGGGSSYAKYDYQQALDAVRDSGKKSIALIDGQADSAAYALACMHDVVYVVNENDEVGCIGTLCAGYTNKDGDVNMITQERYFEVYAEQSPYKNRELRDISSGNEELMQQEINRLCADFRALVTAYRPQVTEEQLEGRVYRAADVMGTLVDGISTMDLCVQEIIDSAYIENKENNNLNQPSGQQTNSQQSVVPQKNESSVSVSTDNKKQKITMKEYPHLKLSLALNELVSDKENGVYLHESLCDTLEEFCATAERNKGTMDAKIAEITKLNAKIAELNAQHAQEIESLNATHSQELQQLKQEHAAALSAQAEESKKEVEGLQEKLEKAEAGLADKDDEIKKLSEATAPAPMPAAPQVNSMEVAGKTEDYETKPVIRPDMTYAEKKEALSARRKKLAELTKV